MSIKKIAVRVALVLLGLFILFRVNELFFLDRTSKKHGAIQFIEIRTGQAFRIYDADKKRWVSQAEWIFKYGELPVSYLPKEEWDKKALELKRKNR